jgi:hypothetical protein
MGGAVRLIVVSWRNREQVSSSQNFHRRRILGNKWDPQGSGCAGSRPSHPATAILPTATARHWFVACSALPGKLSSKTLAWHLHWMIRG